MYGRGNACCFTGHRPQKLPWGYDESRPDCLLFRERLSGLIEAVAGEGVRRFFCGCAQGVDLMAGELTLGLRERLAGVELICVRPCEEQAAGWPPASRERYNALLRRADEVILLQEAYSEGCMRRRNQYMVRHSGSVIAVWDGSSGGTAQTVRLMARQEGCILLLNPITLETSRFLPPSRDGQLSFTERE